MPLEFDYRLHDAWIESVTIGPRRAIGPRLALGSARISDGRLPNEAILRLGAIENFDQVREFFVRFGPKPIARIDCVRLVSSAGSSATMILELDPQGLVQVVCAKLELVPTGVV